MVTLSDPLAMLNSYPTEVRAVTPEAVQKFAREHLAGAATCVVIAGRAEDLRATLGAAFKDAEIIPQKALDLDSISLRSPVKNPKAK